MSINLIGSTFGKLEVISRHSSRNRKTRWNVKCLGCGQKYDLASDTIKKNSNGCIACTKENISRGIESPYWRGGKYISSVFLSNVKRGARKRNIDVSITLEDLDKVWEAQNGICAYSGRKLTLSGEDPTASLDRIDSSIGYHIGNIQFVHKDVNVAKWAMKEEVFLEMIKDIYNYAVDGENKWT